MEKHCSYECIILLNTTVLDNLANNIPQKELVNRVMYGSADIVYGRGE